MLRGGGLAAIRLGAVRRHRLHRRADRPLPGAQRAAERRAGRWSVATAPSSRRSRPSWRRWPSDVPAPDLLEADAADAAALAEVAEATRVVITTVGPYALHGEPLVAACAAAGTDYVDLTGEPEFVDRMWVEHHAEAERTGARLVHCCGFDSIPHDLGAYFTVQQLPEGVPLGVDGYVRTSASFSGGTYHSAINAFARGRQTMAAAKERRAAEPRPAGREVHSAPNRRQPRGGARRLGGTAADDRRRRRPPLRRRARALRPRLHLRSPPRRAPPRHRRRARRRGRRPRRAGAAAADPQAAAEG